MKTHLRYEATQKKIERSLRKVQSPDLLNDREVQLGLDRDKDNAAQETNFRAIKVHNHIELIADNQAQFHVELQ